MTGEWPLRGIGAWARLIARISLASSGCAFILGMVLAITYHREIEEFCGYGLDFSADFVIISGLLAGWLGTFGAQMAEPRGPRIHSAVIWASFLLGIAGLAGWVMLVATARCYVRAWL